MSGVNGHAERMDRVLKRAHIRRGNGALLQSGDATGLDGEAVDWRNPLSELIEEEERVQREAALDALDAAQAALALDVVPDALTARIRELVFEQFRQFEASFIEWLFAAGAHPLAVVRRLYAYTKYRRADLLMGMSFRELGDLLNEEHATVHARCKALFGEQPAGWKKTGEARERMRDAAMGNCNRRGGKKVNQE